MQKIFARYLFIFLTITTLSSHTIWADTIQKAKEIELETIIKKIKNQIKVAEKEIEYSQREQEKIKNKNTSDRKDIIENTHETLETALVDIGEINDSIDDFLGITFPYTRSDGIGNLDITSLGVAASYIGESESYRENFYETYDKDQKQDIDLWDTGIQAISHGLKAINKTLHIIGESIEDRVSNPDLALEDKRTKYKEYRDDLIGYLVILRDNKSKIQALENETAVSTLLDIDLLKKEGELNTAQADLRKAERMLEELKITGQVGLENL